MELPDIGERCSHKDCKQLDFLPIECSKCQLPFCMLHATDSRHGCQSVSNSKPLESQPAESQSAETVVFTCTFEGCKKHELLPVFCHKCCKQVCLMHRLPIDHDCESMPSKTESNNLTPKEKVAQCIGKELTYRKPAGKFGAKSGKTTAKVNEMKLKMKSIGNKSIPIEERIYFHIWFHNKDTPMFFSREHSVGKAIDFIASNLCLKNKNHILQSEKLRLFSVESVILLPLDRKLIDVVTECNISLFGHLYFKYD